MDAPRPYHHGDLRRVLLETAAELVVEVGPNAWSLREVARRAGVSHSAPAHHFGDRPGLIRALATEGFVELGRVLLAADADPSLPVLTRHAMSAEAYVTFATTHPGHYDVMFRRREFELDDAFIEAAAIAYGALRSLVVEILDADDPHGQDVEDLTLASWSMVHGVASLANLGMLAAEGPSRERTVASAVDAVVGVLMTGIEARQRG
jgi:AcrR family transcriptional regulator